MKSISHYANIACKRIKKLKNYRIGFSDPNIFPDALDSMIEREFQILLQKLQSINLENYIPIPVGMLNENVLVCTSSLSKKYSAYNGQLAQDFLVDSLCSQKQNGFFVEVGASHPKLHSNTYFLEKKRNWKGILIEPQPNVCKKIIPARSAVCVQCCIANAEGDADFLIAKKIKILSGLESHIKEDHRKRMKETESIRVQVMPLERVLHDHNAPQKIDYCSIDVEGAEKDVLDSFDFSAFHINIFSIEENQYDLHSDNGIAELMHKEGYIAIKVGWDVLYLAKDFVRSLQK